MGPAVAGTLLITGAAALMAIPLGILGGIYLNEYGGKSALAADRALHGGGDDRRPVDRDGAVHLHLRRAAHPREERVRGRARAGVPDAADHHPHHRPDAVARTERAPGRQLRAREPEGPHDPHRRAAERGARDRQRGAHRSCARRGRDGTPCSSRSDWSRTTPIGASSTASTPRCRWRSSRTRRSLFPTAQDRAWGAALTLILIVFVFTILARVVNAFFAAARRPDLWTNHADRRRPCHYRRGRDDGRRDRRAAHQSPLRGARARRAGGRSAEPQESRPASSSSSSKTSK